MKPATPAPPSMTDEQPVYNGACEQVKRNKWLCHCLSCSWLYGCGAGKRLLVWQGGMCMNFKKESEEFTMYDEKIAVVLGIELNEGEMLAPETLEELSSGRDPHEAEYDAEHAPRGAAELLSFNNSLLVDFTKISQNRTRPRRSTIKKITIHHMAGNLTVESCGNVFANTARQASAQYGIGTDGRVGLYVPEVDRAWTSSSSANDDQAITIEVANDEIGGSWHVSDIALAKLIDLCADICQRRGIEKLIYTGDSRGTLTTHNMFAATNCSGPYLESKLPYVADEVNKRLGIIAEPDKNGCPYGTSTALVKDGSTGNHVKRCQWYLTELGFNVGGIDGICGKKTVAAITTFQSERGLDADGICGPMTWEALGTALANKKTTTQKTPIEITVDNAVADGIVGDHKHWTDVLSGEVPAKPEHIKTLMDKYHDALKGARGGKN